ncbi:hypothetical protein GW931_01660 [archaeon]|nr:hypothetical protein [archaeon]PJC45362.1 MAG: hypothetical protein CO037_01825 [Candidatus Pacearchaeota archaeon CG_4_9_14_0_2_um_filter_30_8]
MAKKVISELRTQFNNSVNTAIIATFGLLMALSWNSLITQYVTKISSYTSFQSQVISTLIITIISVLGIFITTRIFSPKKSEENKK